MDVREVRQNALQPVFRELPARVLERQQEARREVCEKCRNEIDYDQVRRRKAKAGEAS
jgi:hypothetical protein